VEKEIARRLSDFLRDAPTHLAAGEPSTFARNIGLLRASAFQGNAQALARFAGVNRFTIVAWERGTQVPTLLSLAELSLRIELSPDFVLRRRLGPHDFSFSTRRSAQVRQRVHSAPPKHDLERMRQALEDAIRDGVFPRPSLSALADQLGCCQTTLDRRFPELAGRVKDLYRGFAVIRKEVRSKLVRGMVRTSTIALHKAGQYPSMHMVGFGLPSFIDMRDRLAYEEWKRTMTELPKSGVNLPVTLQEWA
jgi:DNA-binding XRE family transcriptional regulator